MKSINDVYKIGKGPSSSHTMGPERACLYVLKNYNNVSHVDVTLYGSLALTGVGHLTDVVIKETLGEKFGQLHFDIMKKDIEHENTMDFKITFENEKTEIIRFLSIGGGDLEIVGQTMVGYKDVYPHNSLNEINKHCTLNKISYVEYILEFEPEIFEYLKEVWQAMKNSVEAGIKEVVDLPGSLKVKRRARKIYLSAKGNDDLLVAAYAYAVSEQNASGNTVVTAPTCGACGVLPGVLYFAQDRLKIDEQKIIEALAVAGLFGAIVKNNASVSGAEAGCQAEVGTATSMAGAAFAYILGGTNIEIESAAEISMEHQLGLTCDPVLGYVQIPCIQRNGVGCTKAVFSAKLALEIAEVETVSFDSIVKVMYETGKDMNEKYRETSLGGLAKYFEQK